LISAHAVRLDIERKLAPLAEEAGDYIRVSRAAVHGSTRNEMKLHKTSGKTNGTLANIRTRHLSNAIRSVTVEADVSDKQLLEDL